jgi:hypothetical protein
MGLFWFFDAPDWVGPVVLTGLIGFIPIVGQMVLYGWLLEARDNLRRGWLAVPRASFDYLQRGAWVVLVTLVFAASFLLLEILVLVGLGIAAASSSSGTQVAIVGLLIGSPTRCCLPSCWRPSSR